MPFLCPSLDGFFADDGQNQAQKTKADPNPTASRKVKAGLLHRAHNDRSEHPGNGQAAEHDAVIGCGMFGTEAVSRESGINSHKCPEGNPDQDKAEIEKNRVAVRASC